MLWSFFSYCSVCLKSERNWANSSDLFPLKNGLFFFLKNQNFLGLSLVFLAFLLHHLSSSICYSRAERQEGAFTFPSWCTATSWMHQQSSSSRTANQAGTDWCSSTPKEYRIANSREAPLVMLLLLFSAFLTSQQGYRLFAFLPGSRRTHTGRLVFCLRAPLSLKGALQIFQIPSSRHTQLCAWIDFKLPSIIRIIIYHSQLDVVPISWMLKQSFSLVIEFPVEFRYSDLLLGKLSILIWKAASVPGQDNGSRIIAWKSLTTGLFSSNKAFPGGYAACYEYDTSSKVCMCVLAWAAGFKYNIPRCLRYIFCKCLKINF